MWQAEHFDEMRQSDRPADVDKNHPSYPCCTRERQSTKLQVKSNRDVLGAQTSMRKSSSSFLDRFARYTNFSAHFDRVFRCICHRGEQSRGRGRSIHSSSTSQRQHKQNKWSRNKRETHHSCGGNPNVRCSCVEQNKEAFFHKLP